nr:SMC family ATPase [Treponema sp.]
MKPLKLILKNIGPFLNEKVDFTALDDIFLITGNTGSGKTTILDAITYALYGDLAGSRGGKNINLHSDYVSKSEQGFVDFTFALNGNQYHVNRSVPYETVTKKGEPRKHAAEVYLEKFDSETQSWKCISDKTQNVLEYIVQLIGLKKDEFSKIVFLPQGEFSRFLSESSAKKEETLAKLFPIEQYKGICEAIASDAKQKEAELQNLRSLLDSEKENYDPVALEAELGAIQEHIQTIQKEESEYTQKLKEYTTVQNTLQQDLQEAKEAASLETQLQHLEQQQEDIHAKKKTLTDAKEALQFTDLLNDTERYQQLLHDCSTTLQQKKDEQKSLSEQRHTLESKRPKHDASKKEIETLTLQISILQERVKKLHDYKKNQQLYEEACNKLCQLYQKIQPALTKAQKTVIQVGDSIAEFEHVRDEKQQQIEKVKDKESEEKIQSLAVTLASQLQDNTPCPVCGSLHHPVLAKAHTDTIDFKTEITRLQAELSQIDLSIEKAKAQLSSLESSSLLMEQYCNDILQHAASCGVLLPDAASLPERVEAVPSTKYIIAMRSTLSETFTTLTSALTALKASDDDSAIDMTALQMQLQESEDTKKSLRSLVDSFEKEDKEIADKESRIKGQIETLSFDCEKYTTSYNESCTTLLKKIEQSSFCDEKSVRNALLPLSEIERLEKLCTDYDVSLQQTKALLARSKVDSSQIGRIQQQLDSIQNEIDTLEV